MSASSASTSTRTDVRTLGLGFVLGLLIAVGFALVIRLVPESWLTDTGPRIAVYVVLALSAPTIVLPLWLLARRITVDPRGLTWAAIGGSLVFDGLALGFFPDLYGQTGDAWAHTAAGLLWAFGWIVVTELAVEQQRS
jgi:drug/metabolite transporter (DMT)-like permease